MFLFSLFARTEDTNKRANDIKESSSQKENLIARPGRKSIYLVISTKPLERDDKQRGTTSHLSLSLSLPVAAQNRRKLKPCGEQNDLSVSLMWYITTVDFPRAEPRIKM